MLGEHLRQRLKYAVQTLLALKGESKLLSSNEVLRSVDESAQTGIYCLCIYSKQS